MKGSIIDRAPLEICDEIVLEFEDAPTECAAVVTTSDGVSYYRKLEDGKCVLPILHGILKVQIKRFGTRIETWNCEGLKIVKIGENRAMIYPENQDIHAELIRVLRENQQIRDEQKRLEGEILATNERLNKAFEGWGIT